MNIEINQIPVYLKKLLTKVTRFLVPIYLCLIIGVIGFLVFKINQFSSLEPDPQQVANQENAIKRVKIDQEAIDKIQNLEEQNVAVKSLFKQARENPFSDN